ncbi:hypothetical protein D3C81_1849600 [compost metagenome]
MVSAAVLGVRSVRRALEVNAFALPTFSALTSNETASLLVAAGAKLRKARVMVAPRGMPTFWKRRPPMRVCAWVAGVV